MKYALSILISMAALTAFADDYLFTSATLPTNNIATASTNTSTFVTIPTNGEATVPLQVTFEILSASTANQTLVFERSVDRVTYETLAARKWSLVVASTGTNSSTTVTNIPTYGAGYVRLVSWGNAATNAVTNLSIAFGTIRKN